MEFEASPNKDTEIGEMEKEIQEIVGAPVIRSVNGLFDDEGYLANSWLVTIHSHVRREQVDTLFLDRPGDEKRQRLVGIANRLEINVEKLLKAEPFEEVRLIYEALLECERSGYEVPDA